MYLHIYVVYVLDDVYILYMYIAFLFVLVQIYGSAFYLQGFSELKNLAV